jgi:acyl-CoA thioesterase
MDAVEFLGLRPTHNPNRFVLPVSDGIISGLGTLFGGCALAAGVAAMEAACDRPVAWATAQYLSFARLGEVMDVDVTVAVSGRHSTQARAVGYVGQREIATVNAALGSRETEAAGRWLTMPDLPPPDECPIRPPRPGSERSIMDRLDMRLALGAAWDDLVGNPVPEGRSALWVRLPGVEMSATTLAILGDYVPFGISQALGGWFPSSSLDNTVRIVRVEPTEWVLVDVRVDAVDRGFGHGRVNLWSESGTLLATASQTASVRDLTPTDVERAVERGTMDAEEAAALRGEEDRA